MATVTSTTNISSLIINKVDTKATFLNMLTNNLVNENELYFIPSELNESNEVYDVTFSTTNGTAYSCNRTYSALSSAINNGYPIYAVVSENNTPIFNLNYDTDNAGTNTIAFTSGIFLDNGSSAYFRITYNSSNVISTTVVPIQTELTNATLTIGSYTYNGTTAVTIPVYNGSYNSGS